MRIHDEDAHAGKVLQRGGDAMLVQEHDESAVESQQFGN